MTKKPEKEENCQVSEKTCTARMQTVNVEIEGLRDYFDEKFKGIKTAIYTVGATIVIIVSILELALTYLHH